MGGNKARRRAAETGAVRQDDTIPLIVDETVLVTPEMAQEMLKRNNNNRPIAWKTVEEYSVLMKTNKFVLHAQGIILDSDGNILTGQKRLWAIIYADVPVYMRVSRGSPPEVSSLLDRGTPQSARDLATRTSGKKHSPSESSISRAVLASKGNVKPSKDELAREMVRLEGKAKMILLVNRGAKKTKALLMTMAAICEYSPSVVRAELVAKKTSLMAEELEIALSPHRASECWGKGAAFGLAMEHASEIVTRELAK